MGVRATQDLTEGIIKTYTVDTSATTTTGMPVKFGASDLLIVSAAAGDAVIFGIALETKTAGQQCQVFLLGHGVVAAKVGTGGATRGTKQKFVSDGFTDTGATSDMMIGRALQSGVVGDLIGLLVGGGT